MSKKSSSIVWAVVLCGLAMLLALGGGQWLWHFICECTPCNKIRVYLKKLCVKGSLKCARLRLMNALAFAGPISRPTGCAPIYKSLARAPYHEDILRPCGSEEPDS